MTGLLDQLREQRKTQQSHTKALRQTLAKAQNPVASAIIEGIIEDSSRDVAVLHALIETRGGEAGSEGAGVVTEDILDEVRRDTRAEAELLAGLGVLAREAKEKRVRAVLQGLLEEQKKRHSTMQALANILQKDSATLADYLDLLQKYVSAPR